jgi:hypothetical protein
LVEKYLKAACAIMKRFQCSKAAELVNFITIFFKLFAEAFRNPLMWLCAVFGNSFMTALQDFGKISKKLVCVFIRPVKNCYISGTKKHLSMVKFNAPAV